MAAVRKWRDVVWRQREAWYAMPVTQQATPIEACGVHTLPAPATWLAAYQYSWCPGIQTSNDQ